MVTYQRFAVHTSDDVRAIADHAGSYFFSPGTMRAFSSRILSGLYAGQDSHDAVPGAVFYFVTSERHGDDAPRHYAVRKAILGTQRGDRPAIDILTVGNYHTTAAQARSAAKTYASKGE